MRAPARARGASGGRSRRAEVLDERWTRPRAAGPGRGGARRAADRVGRAPRQVPAGRARRRRGPRHAPADDRQPAAPRARRRRGHRPDGWRSTRRAAPLRGGPRRAAPARSDRPRRRLASSGSPTRGASVTRPSSAADELDDYFASRLGIEPLGGRADAGGAVRARRRPPSAAEVVPAQPDGDRRDRQHLRRRGAVPRPPASALACRLDEARALRGAPRRDRRRARGGLANGGSSIDDYRDARGERGSMQDEFLVHTREGEPCLRCGETIRRVVVAGRSTYFCPGCQKRLRARPRRRRRAR